MHSIETVSNWLERIFESEGAAFSIDPRDRVPPDIGAWQRNAP